MLKDKEIILHKGIFKRSVSTSDAVFMITGMTIGAGVLAIPYAVAQVGLLAGIVYIAGLGILILFLNLMIGEIAIRTKVPMQLSGFAGRYLGRWVDYLLSATLLLSGFGTLLVYVIGEGNTLSAIFGGNAVSWGVIFWSIGSFLIWGGLEKIKTIEKIFSFIVMSIIAALSLYLLPKFNSEYAVGLFSTSHLFLPIGVILFALHASPAIAEAHALLPDKATKFRRALIIGTIIPIVLYILFAVAVVGFTGWNTTEIATVGLGKALGPVINVIANIFAALAMFTGFIGLGTAMKETLVWDHKFSEKAGLFLVVAIPLLLFLAGIRSFIGTLDIIGTVGISIEAIIMAIIYIKVRKGAEIPNSYVSPSHPYLVSLPVIAFFVFFFGLTVYKYFLK